MKKLFGSATLLFALLISSAASADTYVLDLSHASVGFCAKHLVISTVCGRFKEFDSTIILDESDITKSSWTGTIKTASITTDNEKRDEHLKGVDFLDVQKYPEISFKSSKIEKKGEGYVANGTLTMRGVSKDVSIPFTLNGPIEAFGSKENWRFRQHHDQSTGLWCGVEQEAGQRRSRG